MVNPYRPDALIERHGLAAERLHGDDSTVPILAKGQDGQGSHLGLCPRRPAVWRAAPPAALYYASRDRRHEHPARHLAHFSGILQADAYSGYNGLYDPSRSPGPIIAALCWAHARRQFFELVDIGANARRRKGTAAISPLALEAVKRCSISSVASTGLPPTNVCASGDPDQVSRARRRSYRACEALMSC
jgi:transposase